MLQHHNRYPLDMNIEKLRLAEADFLSRYPKGFADPAMAPIKKKHNIAKLTEFAQANLTLSHFDNPDQLCDTLVKIISRSSMVSMFEKPRFRDFVNMLNNHEKEILTFAFHKRLFGRSKRKGFDEILSMLSYYKVAKWPIITAVPYYFAPQKEAFVKPTTAKGIIKYLEIEGLDYKPQPSWAFYNGYLKALRQVKKEVRPSISPNYAALSGFLMSTM